MDTGAGWGKITWTKTQPFTNRLIGEADNNHSSVVARVILQKIKSENNLMVDCIVSFFFCERRRLYVCADDYKLSFMSMLLNCGNFIILTVFKFQPRCRDYIDKKNLPCESRIAHGIISKPCNSLSYIQQTIIGQLCGQNFLFSRTSLVFLTPKLYLLNSELGYIFNITT